jgi:hypothetical protein
MRNAAQRFKAKFGKKMGNSLERVCEKTTTELVRAGVVFCSLHLGLRDVS